jgi:hypothetical protein
MGTWQAWLHGLVAAIIGGGSSAVTAGITVSSIRPDVFNFHAQIVPMFELMGVLFIVNGAVAAFAYLSKSPLPAEAEVVTTVQTASIEPSPSGTGVQSTKVTQTTTEPKKES